MQAVYLCLLYKFIYRSLLAGVKKVKFDVEVADEEVGFNIHENDGKISTYKASCVTGKLHYT